MEISKQSSHELHENPIVQRVVKDGNRVVAYGTLELVGEVVMVLDNKASLRDKVEALKALMLSAKVEARLLDVPVNYIYMCTSDRKYAELVEKHFGFQIMDGHHFLRLKV